MRTPVTPAPSGPAAPGPRVVARGEGVALILATLAVGLFGALLGLIEWRSGDQQRHHAQLRRLEHHLGVARAFPPRGLEQREWSQALTAVHNALYNVLDHPRHVPTAAIRALADHFDRTQAVELGSLGELFGFIAYLEEICPHAKDYGPFDYLRRSYPAVKPVRVPPPPARP